MRKPSDECLLCKLNNSSKTNSHIFPKSLSRKLFVSDTGNKGYQVNSKYPINHPPQSIQDSPKENYILCPGCETYFGLLETICVNVLNQWKDKVLSGEFLKQQFDDEYSIISCVSSNSKIFRLMIYSIFWRSSVSNHSVFNSFKINREIEEEIRASLFEHKSVDKSELLINLSNKNIPLFPLTIISSDSFEDPSSNLIFASHRKDVYKLIMDQFCLLMFENEIHVANSSFRIYSNLKHEDCKILVYSEKNWNENIVNPIINLIADNIIQNKNLK
ncbi:hypothetical protein [Fluviicola taffensis]|uniref:HNH endonuclease 5 domain-containing protein n=1 Tax=Fluviicola taffensis (strain DSM 16823 / NCIMB 13979 / RW262) TaxID=755732 RepID=F2IGG7_FLUTR|nr:hypothetical protein [Fluviicola taffensis]AEA42573.1 hypothetical protein Fluta_0568 [Fluviicola taffensis DSM 16823]